MDDFMNLLRQNLDRQPPPPPRGPDNTTANAFKAFKALKPPEFQGTADPVEARTWLNEMEKSFEIMGTGDAQKTVFAAYLLKGEANYWWEAKKNMEPVGVIPWGRFTELFLEKYFPSYMEAQMELKFLELKQGILTVAEYEAKFTELSRFVPEYVNTEVKKARRFQQGLKPWIQNKVALLEITDYATLVQKASIVEQGSDQTQKFNASKKRKFESRSGDSASTRFPSKFDKGTASQPARSTGFIRTGNRSVGQGGGQVRTATSSQSRPPLPDCKTCGRKHPGPCLLGTTTCFKCGQTGHYATNCTQKNPGVKCYQCGGMGHLKKDCPKVNPASSKVSGVASNRPSTARTFNMTIRDAMKEPDVIAGTLSLNSISANALFDSGATKSFISQDLAHKLKLKVEALKEPLMIEIANHEIIPVSQICPNCSIGIGSHQFTADLIPFVLGGFDVILGMD